MIINPQSSSIVVTMYVENAGLTELTHTAHDYKAVVLINGHYHVCVKCRANRANKANTHCTAHDYKAVVFLNSRISDFSKSKPRFPFFFSFLRCNIFSIHFTTCYRRLIFESGLNSEAVQIRKNTVYKGQTQKWLCARFTPETLNIC